MEKRIFSSGISSLRTSKQFVKEVYSKAHDSVTWYGKGFDVRFVRSRMLYWRLPNAMPPVHQTDLWETCRSELCISSNRLANFGSFARLEEGKLHMPVSDWKRAAQGSIPHMNKTLKRVKSDVLLLEEAYERLRPYIRGGRLNLGQVLDQKRVCPTCGSRAVRKEGVRITSANRMQRWFCKACTAWSSSPMKNEKLR
jgi:hypothetical protein